MISFKFLPKFFKDVFQHIPTIALKSVEWKEVLKQMGPLLYRMGTKDLEMTNLRTLESLKIPSLGFRKKIVNTPLVSADKKAGEILLSIYFSQLKNPQGVILDLRRQHFNFSQGQLYWSPNNSWFQFDQSFRLGLIELYRGFYFEQDDLFDKGLASLNLTQNLTQAKKTKLKELFHQHFGGDDQRQVKFEISKFTESFYEIFHFFIEEEVRLQKDFIFFGIYLVTLYMHLEQFDEHYDVRSIFEQCFPKEYE